MYRRKISGGVIICFILIAAFFLRGFMTGAAHASGSTACSWTLIPSQNPSTTVDMYATTAISAKDAWMVGAFSPPSSSGPYFETLTERWNGTAWRVVPSPNPGVGYNELLGVAHIPGGGLWAVGYMSNTTNGPRTDQTLIEHWNGKSWQVVASPNVGPNSNDLQAVVALSATDAWAVGSYVSTAQNNPIEVLIEHWDGTQWSVIQGANPSITWNDLAGIAAVSANDIWAVGFQRPQSVSGPSSTATLIEHWDGTQWSVVASPSPANYSNGLGSISIVSANSIWAVGGSFNTGPGTTSTTQTLIEHWDGIQWSVVASPDPQPGGDVLNGVVALSNNNAWAVGDSIGTNDQELTLVMHWNGKVWSVVPSPNDGTDNNLLQAVTRIPGTSHAWAAGVHVLSGTDQEGSYSLYC